MGHHLVCAIQIGVEPIPMMELIPFAELIPVAESIPKTIRFHRVPVPVHLPRVPVPIPIPSKSGILTSLLPSSSTSPSPPPSSTRTPLPPPTAATWRTAWSSCIPAWRTTGPTLRAGRRRQRGCCGRHRARRRATPSGSLFCVSGKASRGVYFSDSYNYSCSWNYSCGLFTPEE